MATGEKSSQVRSIRWVLLPAILLLLAVVVKVYNYHPGSIRLVGYSFLQIAATSTAHLISQASPISAEDSFAITQTALTGLLLFFGGLGTYLLAFVLSKKCYPQPVVGWGALTAGALSIITVGSNALNHPEIASLWIATGWSGWIILKVNKTGQWRWLGWVLFVAILGMDLFLHSTTTLIYIIFCASILLWQIATSTPRKISSSIAIAITLVTMITLLIMVAQPRPAATIDFQATGILHVLGINAEIETYQLAGILLIVTSFVGLFLSFRRSLPIIGGWVLCTAIMLDPKLASIEFVYLSCSIIAGISIAFGNGNLVAQIANSMWHQNTRNLGLIPAIILSTFALLANIQILNGTAWEWYQPNSDLASLLAKVPPGSRVLYLKDNLAENALITTLYNNQPPVNNDLQRIKNTLATTSDHELIIRTLQQAGFTAVITDSYAPLSIASINNELLVTARGYYYLLVVAGNQPKLQALMATNDLSPARTENPIDHPLISGNYITSSTPNSFYLLRSTPEFVSNEEFEIPVTLPGKLVADDYWQREKWLPAKVYARIAGERKMEMKLEYTLPSISQAGIELFPVAPVTEIVEVSREKLLISGGIGGLISVNPQTDRFVLSGEVLLDAQGKILAFGENQVETVSYIPKFDDCPITESSALGRQCATISAEPTIPTSYLLTIETSVLTDIQNVCIDPEHAEGCAYRLATQSFVVPGGDIKISLQSSERLQASRRK